MANVIRSTIQAALLNLRNSRSGLQREKILRILTSGIPKSGDGVLNIVT